MITKTAQARPTHRYKIRKEAQDLHYPVAVEQKYDGELEYVVVTESGVVLFNKYGRTRTDMPCTNDLESLNLPHGTVLLAELVWEQGKDFYAWQRNKLDENMSLVIFDVLREGSYAWRSSHYHERRSRLERLIYPVTARYDLSRMDTAGSYREVRAIADTYIRDGYEGAVVKSISGVLVENNNLQQAKVKKVATFDLRVGVGVVGRNSVELLDRTGRRVCNTSTVGHEYVHTNMLVEVECTEVIQPSGSLRNPRIKCVRLDKVVADLVPSRDHEQVMRLAQPNERERTERVYGRSIPSIVQDVHEAIERNRVSNLTRSGEVDRTLDDAKPPNDMSDHVIDNLTQVQEHIQERICEELGNNAEPVIDRNEDTDR